MNIQMQQEPRYAANLSMLYPDLPFLERFEASAKDGFTGVEILFPYDVPAQELRSRLLANGLELVLINTPAGRLADGDRGLLGLPEREQEFRQALRTAIGVAKTTECKRVHLMMGRIAPENNASCDSVLESSRTSIIANLRFAAKLLADEGMIGLLEPINRRDIPGYLLTTQRQACELLDDAGESNLALQLDLYHCQIVEGDVVMRIREHFAKIGHVQVAGVPTRHEPGNSELDLSFVLQSFEDLGYQGWIGCEYIPADSAPGGTTRGLSWRTRVKQRRQENADRYADANS